MSVNKREGAPQDVERERNKQLSSLVEDVVCDLYMRMRLVYPHLVIPRHDPTLPAMNHLPG